MSNYTTGTVANIIVEPARILIAPIGTAVPATPTSATTVTWDTAFKEVGYTQKGIDLTYTPTFKDINVDEEMAAVKQILTAEKATVSAVLSEATLKNLSYAIAASTLTVTPAGASQVGVSELHVGSGTQVEHIIAFEGKSPQGFPRIFVGYRGLCAAAVKLAFQRTTETTINFEVNLLADSNQSAGSRLFKIIDITAVATS
jgi:stage V sporulation protein SpoVS